MSTGWKSKFDPLRVETLLKTEKTSLLLENLLNDSHTSQVWMTDWRIDDEMREHIRTLGIPNVPDCPNPPMALHRVGSFMDDEILKSRMKSIFGGRNTFLLNASGTGKTRILYEGLGFHWGFYFTSAVDTTRLGDRDLSSIINTGGLFGKKQFSFLPSEGDISVDLHDNLSLAHTYFSAVLLARLLIFKIFLDSAVAHGYKDEYKTIWLKVQLQLWSDDSVIPFRALINDLVDSFTQPEDFDAAISDTIEEIFSIQDISPVFVLLDEANSAVRRLQYSFRDDCGNSYPALKAVLNVWKHHLGHRPEFTFVVAGTEIPREYFVGEDWSDWTWSSDTGAFDDPERQREYIKAFLPSALYSSPAGQRLCDRIWKWARGRHRATAAFISLLLEYGFKIPHMYLTAYVDSLTDGYRPQDFEEEDKGRFDSNHRGLPFGSFNFKILESNRRLASCIHERLISLLVQSEKGVYYPGEDVALVNNSFGRFVDTNCDCIVVDEPLLLTAAALWHTKQSHSLVNLLYFKEKIFTSDLSLHHILGYTVTALASSFNQNRHDGRILSEVFTPLTGLEGVHGFIVTCKAAGKKDTVFQLSSDPSRKFVRSSDSAEETISWMKDSQSMPFCIHAPTEPEATLIFVVRTSNRDRFWVFLRVLPETPKDEVAQRLKDLADSMHPERIFGDVISPVKCKEALHSLPGLSTSVGNLGVLRAILSYAQVLEDPDFEFLDPDEASVSSVSGINMDTLLASTKAFASNKTAMDGIFNAIVSSAVSSGPSPPKRKHEDLSEISFSSNEERETGEVSERPTLRVERPPARKRPNLQSTPKKEDQEKTSGKGVEEDLQPEVSTSVEGKGDGGLQLEAEESTTSDVEAGEPVSVASEIPKEESAGTPPPSATERPSRIAAPASASSE